MSALPVSVTAGHVSARTIAQRLCRMMPIFGSTYAQAYLGLTLVGLFHDATTMLACKLIATGAVNCVFFPVCVILTALYPLWMRFALYREDSGIAPWMVLGALAVAFVLACWGHDPQRGFGPLARRGGPA